MDLLSSCVGGIGVRDSFKVCSRLSRSALSLLDGLRSTHGQSLFRATDPQRTLRSARATLGTGCPRSAHPTDYRNPSQSRVHHTNSKAQKAETTAGFTRFRRGQGSLDRETTLRPNADHQRVALSG